MIEAAVIRRENHIPGFDEMYFHSFISVGIETPILRPGAIPKADAVQARQSIVWNCYPGIVPLGKGGHPDFAGLSRQNLGLASINIPIGRPVQRHRSNIVSQYLPLFFKQSVAAYLAKVVASASSPATIDLQS